MGEIPPLIPRKETQLCHDVQPVIRELFRSVVAMPPIIDKPKLRKDEEKVRGPTSFPLILSDDWTISKGTIPLRRDDHDVILTIEKDIQNLRAKQLNEKKCVNQYKLSRVNSVDWWSQGDGKKGLLEFNDLLPPNEIKLCPDSIPWIRSIKRNNLVEDSCSSSEESSTSILPDGKTEQIHIMATSEVTSQSISIGEWRSRKPRAALPQRPAPQLLHLVRPFPLSVDFVNFRLGQTYTKKIRLVNVSGKATRFSITPPQHASLRVELSSNGTSATGGTTKLYIVFTPLDVRAVHDELRVNVRGGQSEVIPINCYVKPPLLNVLLLGDEPSCLGTECACSCWTEADTIDLGSVLVGSVRRVNLLFHCESRNVAFFLVTDESWLDWSITNITRSGAVLADPFVVHPAYMAGGGGVAGTVWCIPQVAGLHVRSVRILATTAVLRELLVLADAVYFQKEVIIIMADEKDYDICTDEDSTCEYYVNLGTTFPRRTLSKEIQVINKSPVAYEYYWRCHPWGVCLCDQDGDVFDPDFNVARGDPEEGHLKPRSTSYVKVTVPDAGRTCGLNRAILELVIRDVPKKSFPPGYEANVVSFRTVFDDSIPGIEAYSVETCDVVCARIEVWWQVNAVHIFLEPCRVLIPHSERVKEVTIRCLVRQLSGTKELQCEWRGHQKNLPRKFLASPLQAHANEIKVQLGQDLPVFATYEVIAGYNECSASLVVERRQIKESIKLGPPSVNCGVLAPLTKHQAKLTLTSYGSDVKEKIPYIFTAWRDPSVTCKGCDVSDNKCGQPSCACSLMSSPRSIQKPGRNPLVVYEYHDDTDKVRGPRLTLVQLNDEDGGPVQGQCSLIAVYNQPPVVVLKLLSGTEYQGLKAVELDACSIEGTYVARPLCPITLGLVSTFMLRLQNLSPVDGVYQWRDQIDKTDSVEMCFNPVKGFVKGYSYADVEVSLRGVRVCTRNLSLRTCEMLRSQQPIHLVVEATVTGIAVSFELPVDAEKNIRIKVHRSQPEPGQDKSTVKNLDATLSVTDIFTSYETLKRPDLKCCCYEEVMEEIDESTSDVKQDESKLVLEFTSIPRITPESCYCPHYEGSLPSVVRRPELVEHVGKPCLQFVQMPLRTVCEKIVSIRNESDLDTLWSSRPVHFPRTLYRTLETDKWHESCLEAGLAAQCIPSAGKLPARACVEVHVQIYANTWGVYCEQIIFQVVGVEPLVLDVWVEAVGSPLQLAMQPTPLNCAASEPTIWFTQGGAGEEKRELRVRNISRASVQLHMYPCCPRQRDTEKVGTLPFRVMIRFEDTAPPCRCSSRISDETDSNSNESVNIASDNTIVGTGIVLYLGPDYGRRDLDYYQVKPENVEIAGGDSTVIEITRAARPPQDLCSSCDCPEALESPPPTSDWPTASDMPAETQCVAQNDCPTPLGCVHPPKCPVPPGTLLMDMQPAVPDGAGWRRSSPGTMVVHLTDIARLGELRVTPNVLTVRLCAADLPDEPVRVRKRVRLDNIGTGPLEGRATCEPPWNLINPKQSTSPSMGTRTQMVLFHLQPKRFLELYVELTARAEDVVPLQIPYKQRLILEKPLTFLQDNQVIQSACLELDLEYTSLQIEPDVLDFGFCNLNDSRKEYFTVTHTSRTTVLNVTTHWCGGDEFKLFPARLRLAPGQRGVVYVQYIPRRAEAPVTGCACVQAARAPWCSASVVVYARASHDAKFRAPGRSFDYTDDTVLSPVKPKLYY